MREQNNRCPECGGSPRYLGHLDRHDHFRCKACAVPWDYFVPRDERKRNAAAPPFRRGDLIRHTGKFLRSVGWHVGVPVDGQILEVKQLAPGRDCLQVEWSDGNTSGILSCHVEFEPHYDAVKMTLRRRVEGWAR